MTEPISWGKFLLWQKRFFFGGGFTAQDQPFDFFLNLVIISGIISDGAQYGKNSGVGIFNKKLCYAENGVLH